MLKEKLKVKAELEEYQVLVFQKLHIQIVILIFQKLHQKVMNMMWLEYQEEMIAQ